MIPRSEKGPIQNEKLYELQKFQIVHTLGRKRRVLEQVCPLSEFTVRPLL